MIGGVVDATAEQAQEAAGIAAGAWRGWDALGGAARREILSRAADLMEAHGPELMAMAVREAGKTLPDAVAELREAVDFLRYYGARAAAEFEGPSMLPGPTGEDNSVALQGSRRLPVHQPVELPARHLHRPGLRRAGGRQCGDRQAGGADAADRLSRGATAARGRGPAGGAAAAARRRADRRRRAAGRSEHRRRRLHRLHRDGAADQPHPGRPSGPDPAADRRDRRPERHDRRFDRACRSRW